MRSRRTVTAVAVLVAVFAVLSVAASAQDDAPDVIFRALDSRDTSRATATLLCTDSPDACANAEVTVNGTVNNEVDVLDASLADLNGALAIVVDTGTAMDESGALVEVKEKLKTLIPLLSDQGVSVGLFIAGDTADVVQSFTANTATLVAAIDRLAPSPGGGTALWGAIELAGSGLEDRADELQPNLMVVVGGNDEVTIESQDSARGAAISSGALIFNAELMGQGLDPSALNDLTETTGGVVTQAGDVNGLGGNVESLTNVLNDDQYELTFDAGLAPGEVAEIDLTVGDITSSGSVVLGGTADGRPVLEQFGVQTSPPLPFLQNSFGLALALLLVGLAVAGAAYAVTLLFTKDDELTSVLQPYAEGFVSDEIEEEETAIAKSAIIARAVELTEQVAERQGYLARIEGSLERANLPLRAGEAVVFYMALLVVVILLAFVVFGNPIGALIVGILAALLPVMTLSFLAGQRKKRFLTQLPDTLQLLSGTLRAGYSLMQGVEAVSQEVEDPMGIELRRVVTESRLGRPLEEALDSMAERMDSPDFSWAVMAIRIQREVGGNLSELLMTVAETMTHRERLRREIAALTAEGRISAYVLAALPILLGFAMWTINPTYMSSLVETTLGIIMLVLAGVGMLVGFLWMRKIIDIEI